MDCVNFIVLVTGETCCLFSFYSVQECAHSTIMLWVEGCRKLAYKIFLIKMRDILVGDLPVSWRCHLFMLSVAPSGMVSKTEQQSVYFQVQLHLGLQLR